MKKFPKKISIKRRRLLISAGVVLAGAVAAYLVPHSGVWAALIAGVPLAVVLICLEGDEAPQE